MTAHDLARLGRLLGRSARRTVHRPGRGPPFRRRATIGGGTRRNRGRERLERRTLVVVHGHGKVKPTRRVGSQPQPVLSPAHPLGGLQARPGCPKPVRRAALDPKPRPVEHGVARAHGDRSPPPRGAEEQHRAEDPREDRRPEREDQPQEPEHPQRQAERQIGGYEIEDLTARDDEHRPRRDEGEEPKRAQPHEQRKPVSRAPRRLRPLGARGGRSVHHRRSLRSRQGTEKSDERPGARASA